MGEAKFINTIILCMGVFIMSLTVGCDDSSKTFNIKEEDLNIKEFYEELVLVDNEDLKISVVSVHYVSNYGIVELNIENKSNELIFITLDKLFFSGIERKARLLCDVNPKSSSTEYIYIEGINSLEDFNDKVEGTFNTLDKENNQYEFMFKG